jgi:hypothetical protein
VRESDGGGELAAEAAAPAADAAPAGGLSERLRPRPRGGRARTRSPPPAEDEGGFVLVASPRAARAAERHDGAAGDAEDAGEAFLLGAPPGAGAGAEAEASEVPWQAASRGAFLHSLAALVAELGAAPPPDRRAPEAPAAAAARFSLALAALQLFDLALKEAEGGGASPTAGDGARAAAAAAAGGGFSADAAGMVELRRAAAAALREAHAAAAALAAAAPPPELPDPWTAAHGRALAWAKDAAADELLGNYARAAALYARAGRVLHFLAAEAPGLELEPPAAPPAREGRRLRRCAAAAAARWAACASAAASGDTA